MIFLNFLNGLAFCSQRVCNSIETEISYYTTFLKNLRYYLYLKINNAQRISAFIFLQITLKF
ncbi:hypothetical protein D2C80_08080 [Helicobacter pylori]|nr:hypothetical protein D2C80_08080 [Helicobacter pylori]